jgi:hypothetical protein
VRGRGLPRLLQDRLDLTALREVRRHDVAGGDGVVRTRAERGRTRPLATVFGHVKVSRIAYRSPGRPNVHPLDGALNLPGEKHSHGRSSAGRVREFFTRLAYALVPLEPTGSGLADAVVAVAAARGRRPAFTVPGWEMASVLTRGAVAFGAVCRCPQ